MDNIEGHPIPQDITGFQFHMIGNMTIKQFAYLGVGVIVAWIFLALPILGLIKIPIAVVFLSTGIILAFLPIQGRPADAMIGLFLKTLLQPNQYVYKNKQDDAPTTTTVAATPKNEEIVARRDVAKGNNKDNVFFESNPPIPMQSDDTPQITPEKPAVANPSSTSTNNPQEEEKIIAQAVTNMAQEVSADQEKIAEVKKEEVAQDGVAAQETHQKTLDLEQKLQEALLQKQQMEQELLALQQKLNHKQTPVFTPGAMAAPAVTQNVKVIPDDLKKVSGAPFVPDVPNLITGVVKDSRGNVLPNILVEVKDKDDNPVRAFKTNGLGQFASATPLTNGTYSVVFEDPKKHQQFDAVELSATGEIIQPIEVISIDEREELRKSLFT